jgi:hypothetical protein
VDKLWTRQDFLCYVSHQFTVPFGANNGGFPMRAGTVIVPLAIVALVAVASVLITQRPSWTSIAVTIPTGCTSKISDPKWRDDSRTNEHYLAGRLGMTDIYVFSTGSDFGPGKVIDAFCSWNITETHGFADVTIYLKLRNVPDGVTHDHTRDLSSGKIDLELNIVGSVPDFQQAIDDEWRTIQTVHWDGDVLRGNPQNVGDLIPPPAKLFENTEYKNRWLSLRIGNLHAYVDDAMTPRAFEVAKMTLQALESLPVDLTQVANDAEIFFKNNGGGAPVSVARDDKRTHTARVYINYAELDPTQASNVAHKILPIIE